MVTRARSIESAEYPRATDQTLNYGSVEGRLITLSEAKGGADIVLLDRVFGARVRSRISAEWIPIAKEAWGGRVYIEGRVLRDAERGRPIRIVDVSSIQPLPEIQDGALLAVAGIWEAPEGYEIVTARAADLDDSLGDA